MSFRPLTGIAIFNSDTTIMKELGDIFSFRPLTGIAIFNKIHE